MKENPIRRILTGLKYKSGPISITYVNRGSPNDLAVIAYESISKIYKGSFLLNDGETQIPYHRITKISVNGAIVYSNERKGVPDGM